MPLISTRPTIGATSKKIEFNLEALRGVAALIVVWCHAVDNERLLDPQYTPTGIGAFLAPSHLSVLLFFVLSGYVIGLSTKERLAGNAIRVYLKKRLVRIYPIYFVCLLAALAVAQPYPLQTLLGNFSFTQVLLTDVVAENDPSWSLHYEVLYYLLFIPLSYFRLPALPTALACLTVATLNMHLSPEHPLLSSYALGFGFWLVGLGMAQAGKHLPRREASAQMLLGMMLVLLSLHYYNALDTIWRKLLRLLTGEALFYLPGQPYATQIRFTDVAFLPYAVAFIFIFANKDFPFRRYLLPALMTLPALTLAYVATHYSTLDLGPYGFATALYASGVLLQLVRSSRVEQVCRRVMSRLIWVGSLSYGLYIVHMPIMHLLHKASFGTGSAWSFWGRFIVLVVVSLLAAYLLEKKFQPRIKRVLE